MGAFSTGHSSMQIPTGEPAVIKSLAGGILDACGRVADAAENDTENGPEALTQAFDQLVDVLSRVTADTQATGMAGAADITEIGEYALQLLARLAAAVEQSGLTGQRDALARLAVNLALWAAAHGGRIDSLESVVDALALLANTTRDPQQLEELSSVFSRIIAAVPAVTSQDLEKLNPGRPWRVLLLNQSIVATRSYNTALMEAAFAVLTSKLPEDAAPFFSEGMQQMEALDYPAHVRAVMEKYHRRWNVNRSLH
jgi:hypothetical protein